MARQYYFTGTAAPLTTPPFNGATFVDTSAGVIYWAKGTASSADWIALPTNLSDLTIDADLALGGLYKIKKALGLDFQTALERTIATGAVTQTQSYHTIDTQSDAAADDLDTITIASDMSMLLVTLENAARIVTLKHGTGNLNLPDDADIVMAANTVYFLLYNGTAWNLVGSSGGGTAVDPLVLTEIAAPSTPSSGTLAIYADSTTSLPTAKNDAGTVIQMGGGQYRTISFNAGGMTPRATNGAESGTFETGTNDLNYDFFDFDATTNEAVQVAFMMPDEWDGGDVKFKFIWTNAAVEGTGNVLWSVSGGSTSNNDALDTSLGVAKTRVDAFTSGTLNKSASATALVTIAGSPALGDLVILEFERAASVGTDTYDEDARLLNVTMQYKELDTITAAW